MKPSPESRPQGTSFIAAQRANVILALLALTCVFSGLNLWRQPASSATQINEAEPTVHLKNHPLLQRLREIKTVNSANAANTAALWREAQLLAENARFDAVEAELQDLTNESARVRGLLATQIPNLLQEDETRATRAPKLAESMAAWARAGSWLGFFPNDGTPDSAEAAQRLAFFHEQTRQAFLQRHQARYNLVATEQLRAAWSELGGLDKLIGRDNAAMARTCRIHLGPLDQGLLDMPTGQLYKQVLEFVQGKISKEDFQQLVQDLLKTPKKTIDEV